MHPRTQATLKHLAESEWFSNVGVRNTEHADVLSSWREAIEHCSAQAWEDLCLEAANQFCERLVEASPERFMRWNEIAAEMRLIAVDIVREKTASVIAQHQLPKVFVDCVNWDISHLLMESEYADVFPPAFFASQAYWYTAGHFPCGWRGDFPAGRLVIY